MALTLRHAIPRTLARPPSLACVQNAAISTALPRHCPTTNPPRPAVLDLGPRWLSDLKKRVGYCISFGLGPPQVEEAGRVLAEIADGWRELVVGSEGFLTGVARRGLFKHEVVWGEMLFESIETFIRRIQPGEGPRREAGVWFPRLLFPSTLRPLLWLIGRQLAVFAAVVGFNVHVNNIMYNRYAESARVKLLHNLALYIDPAHGQDWRSLVTAGGIGLILRSIQTVYKFPMTWPDRITVYHKLRPLPADPAAFDLDVIILSELHQRPAARCAESLVVYDYQQGRKAAMPSFMRDVFEETLRLQDTAKIDYSRRVQSLLERVKRLERESWNREGEKEDVGNAVT